MNRNGQQLSIGSEPLPDLYAVLTATWAALFVAWLLVWVIYRRGVVPVHTLLLVVSFMKLLVVIVALSYWKVCETSGQCLEQLKYLQSFLFAVSETAFFCSLLLISKGWKITRER